MKVICVDASNSDLTEGAEYEVYAQEYRGGIDIYWLYGWPHPFKKERFIKSDEDAVKIVNQILNS